MAFALGTGLYALADTRSGVHLVFSTFGIGEYTETRPHERADAPLAATPRTVAATVLPLPSKVLQPSGISWDAASGRFALVTDQADLFILPSDLSGVQDATVVQAGPLLLRQGHTETVTMADGAIYIAGGHSHIKQWSYLDEAWQEGDVIPFADALSPDGDIMAMAVDPTGRTLFYADEGGNLNAVDLVAQSQTQLVLEGATKDGRTLSEYTITGLSYADGTLYALTSYHHNILAIDPASGVIEDAWALQGIKDPSGLAVRAGEAFVTVDHEYTEPAPGLQVFALSRPDRS
ncbi:hypothetical protein [Yoonia sp. SS1-5]|uniref:Uncharacterized protein n=1 Tax=Yoonia rhodophyticola TaxID=3137370 RepID=A0AAN0NLE9_9RHOB